MPLDAQLNKPRLVPENDQERAAVEATLQAMRDAKTKLKQARDPGASRKAYSAIFAQTNAVAQMVVAAAADDANDQEDDRVVVNGTVWKSAGTFTKTYQSTRGPIAVKRKLYRSERNGPTRCFHDERRGVIGGLFTQELGRAVVLGVAQLPADRASELLQAATGYPVAPSSDDRSATASSTRMAPQRRSSPG